MPGLFGAWDCATAQPDLAELQYYSFTIDSCYHSVWIVTLCEKWGCMYASVVARDSAWTPDAFFCVRTHRECIQIIKKVM